MLTVPGRRSAVREIKYAFERAMVLRRVKNSPLKSLSRSGACRAAAGRGRDESRPRTFTGRPSPVAAGLAGTACTALASAKLTGATATGTTCASAVFAQQMGCPAADEPHAEDENDDTKTLWKHVADSFRSRVRMPAPQTSSGGPPRLRLAAMPLCIIHRPDDEFRCVTWLTREMSSRASIVGEDVNAAVSAFMAVDA